MAISYDIVPGYDRQIAEKIIGVAWMAVRLSGGTQPENPSHRLFPGAIDAEWCSNLPLPIGKDRAAGQTVALFDRGLTIERTLDEAELHEAYERAPRTRVYESLDTRSAGWLAMVGVGISELARCQTSCSVYESRTGDEVLGMHCDGWRGVVTQLDGQKAWWLGEDAFDESRPPTVVMNPGDILIVPEGLPHYVAVTDSPGYSRHLTIALITREPLTAM